jgi:hypothetical protein
VIFGFFFPKDVPRVTAALHLPRLGKGGSVQLLVDTGAGHCVIHPLEARRLHLDFDHDFQGRPREPLKGIGGGEEVWLEPAEITLLHHDGQETFIQEEIRIAVPTGDNQDLFSLLGRDILSRFRLVYCSPKRELTLTVP